MGLVVIDVSVVKWFVEVLDSAVLATVGVEVPVVEVTILDSVLLVTFLLVTVLVLVHVLVDVALEVVKVDAVVV